MTPLNLKIEGMSCGNCVKHVQHALRALDGVDVSDVQVGSASLTYDPAKRTVDDILAAIRDQGYQPNPVALA